LGTDNYELVLPRVMYKVFEPKTSGDRRRGTLPF
jgi:hypothetical protein